MDWLRENAIALVLVVLSGFGSFTAISVSMAEVDLRLVAIESSIDDNDAYIETLEARMRTSEINDARSAVALEGLVTATTELTKQVGILSVEVGKLQAGGGHE